MIPSNAVQLAHTRPTGARAPGERRDLVKHPLDNQLLKHTTCAHVAPRGLAMSRGDERPQRVDSWIDDRWPGYTLDVAPTVTTTPGRVTPCQRTSFFASSRRT